MEVDWRLIFLVNLPLAAVALVASRRCSTEVRHPDEGGLPDLLGIVALVAGIGGLVLCIVEGASWGWASPAFIGGVLVALALLGAFLARCASHPNPVVELPLLRLRPFALANGSMLLFYVGLRRDAAQQRAAAHRAVGGGHVMAGLMISLGPLTVALLSVQVSRSSPASVPASSRIGCLLLAAGGAWWAAWIDGSPAYVTAFLPGMIVGAIGVGLTQASLFGLTARVVPAHRFATGFGVLNMSRQIGLALGVAILVALLGAAPPSATSATATGRWSWPAARRRGGGWVAGRWFTRRVRLPERIEGDVSAPPLADGGRRAPARGRRGQRPAPAPVDAVDRRRADVRPAAS